jgi:hypothetical protein
LNPRPSDYKSDALPAELRQRYSNRVRIAERAKKLQGGVRDRSTSIARPVENNGLFSASPIAPIPFSVYSLA